MLIISNTYSTTILKEEVIHLKENAFFALQSYFSQHEEEKEREFLPLVQERGYRHLGNKESYLIRDENVHVTLKPLLPLIKIMHEIAVTTLKQIEQSLNLTQNSLSQLVSTPSSASVCRLFRYFPTTELAAAEHIDTGLVSVILKSTYPALEVLDFHTFEWINLESTLQENEAVVMVGDSLSYVTDRKIISCMHRVGPNKKERYSIVYQLRMDEQAIYHGRTGKQILEEIRSQLDSVNGSYIKK